ncbi:MAG: hypothetical protein U5L76_04890 [Patescibacteria group bacterium]|nr:hypothetical protein [Patescibacteria group bacterium]
MNLKKIIPWHTILFSFYPVIYLYERNIQETFLREIIFLPLVVMILALIFFFIINFIIENIYKSGLIVTVLLFFTFSYGPLYYTGFKNIFNKSIFLIIWLFFMLLVIGLIFCIKKDFIKINKIINFSVIILLLISLSNIFIYNIKNQNIGHALVSNKDFEKFEIDNRELPDIYYLIFDRYGRDDVLEDYFNFDNNYFTTTLEKRGFYIADKSHSNYLKTAHSLNSSLNMKYLNEMAKKVSKEKSDWMPLYLSLRGESEVSKRLKNNNYYYIHSGSWWGATAINETADKNINNLKKGPIFFARQLYDMTIFSTLNKKLSIKFPFLNRFDFYYKNTLEQFNNLNKIPNIKQPTYSFFHFLLPHDPYVFDEKGNYVSKDESSKNSERENYIKQLKFTNSQILKFIEKALSKEGQKPIIILQADEGPYPERWWPEDSYKKMSWETASNKEFKVKNSILNAYYLPNVDTSDLYPEITPVNTFRYIFNKYFNTDYEYLPDKLYSHTDWYHPYDFFEITERIK